MATRTRSSLNSTSVNPNTDVHAGNVVAFQLSGTFSGTITFQSTIDGTNWISTGAFPISESGTAATTAAAAGIWRVKGAGLTGVRAACTTYVSGALVVDVQSLDENSL